MAHGVYNKYNILCIYHTVVAKYLQGNQKQESLSVCAILLLVIVTNIDQCYSVILLDCCV